MDVQRHKALSHVVFMPFCEHARNLTLILTALLTACVSLNTDTVQLGLALAVGSQSGRRGSLGEGVLK